MLFESIDLYVDRCAKGEQMNLTYLSEWKDRVKGLVVDCISDLKEKFKSPKCKVLNKPDVKYILDTLSSDFVLVPAGKEANNVKVACVKYHIETLVTELDISTTSNTSSTYIQCTKSFDKILRTCANIMNSVVWKCLRKTRTFHSLSQKLQIAYNIYNTNPTRMFFMT